MGHHEGSGRARRYADCRQPVDPDHGLNREARSDRLFDVYTETETRPPGVSDWPRVHTAILRGGMFVIEATTPSYDVMLRFYPAKPDGGDYEIHHNLPRGKVEKGHTIRVLEVRSDTTEERVAMLKPFNVRYFIVTGAGGFGVNTTVGDVFYPMGKQSNIPIGASTNWLNGEAIYIGNTGKPVRVVLTPTTTTNNLYAVTGRYE